MRLWKVIGLAGLAGVAATGVAVARAERRRQAYTPEEIRSRLHARMDEAAADGPPPGPAGLGAPATPTGRVSALRAAATTRVAPAADRIRAAAHQVAARLRAPGSPGRHRNH